MAETGTQILDLAERLMRLRGYHAVSFRELADELGIKSASIHYHFRRKEDLGLAVVDRYAKQVADALGEPGQLGWSEAVRTLSGVYRRALHDQKLQCLCGMLAAESPGLPHVVTERVTAYYEANITWLMASLTGKKAEKRIRALRVQSEIQGAMTLSISLGDNGVFDAVAKRIQADA